MSNTQPPARTTRQELHQLAWTMPMNAIATRFGITSNGLAKLYDRLNIPRPPRNYWTRSTGQQPPIIPLSPAPKGSAEVVLVGGKQSLTRRPRTRLSQAERREQLMDEAAAIILESGVQNVTLKQVARRLGISETQAHNCFTGRLDLIVSLTRREIAAVENQRKVNIARGSDRLSRIVISTVTYLHGAAERGPLLQLLLRNPDVRSTLRAERKDARTQAREPLLQSLSDHKNFDRAVANASTAALSAICLRAGGLIAAGRVPLSLAETMCLSLIIAGSRSNTAHASAST